MVKKQGFPIIRCIFWWVGGVVGGVIRTIVRWSSYWGPLFMETTLVKHFSKSGCPMSLNNVISLMGALERDPSCSETSMVVSLIGGSPI